MLIAGSIPLIAAGELDVSGVGGTIHARTLSATDQGKSDEPWFVVVQSSATNAVACGVAAEVDGNDDEVEIPFVVVVPTRGPIDLTVTITVMRGATIILIERVLVHRLPHPADLNDDGRIDSVDLTILLSHWGRCVKRDECIADLDHDGWVDGRDMSVLVSAWHL